MSNKSKYIAVDFDGTVTTHEYPKIGRPIPNCIETLLKLEKTGHKIILYTMRSGTELAEAYAYLKGMGLEIYSVNRNPSQETWTSSKKIYAHLYIDDAALGIPLKEDETICKRPWVDWYKVEEYLTTNGYL